MDQQNKVAPHTPLPWTWHAKSIDQAHNGSIYRMERPGHAYAIAMQPRYVDDKEFNANAAFITRACNSHYALVELLVAARERLNDDADSGTPGWKGAQRLVEQIDAALSAAKGET